MELSFATVELRSICEKRQKALGALGTLGSTELATRLSDLLASETVSEFAELFPDEVGMLPPDEFTIRLKSGFQLRLVAGHVDVPRLNSAATDWSQVSRVKLIALEPADA